jgi:hypothetical protein
VDALAVGRPASVEDKSAERPLSLKKGKEAGPDYQRGRPAGLRLSLRRRRVNRIELGSHVGDGTVAAHGCDSAIDDVVCDAVEDPGAAFRWRLNAVALKICMPIGNDDPSRLGIEHVVVQGNYVVTNRRRATDFIPSVSRGPGDIGGVALRKIITAAHEVKVTIDRLLRLVERH